MESTGQKKRFGASVLARQLPEELRPTFREDLQLGVTPAGS